MHVCVVGCYLCRREQHLLLQLVYIQKIFLLVTICYHGLLCDAFVCCSDVIGSSHFGAAFGAVKSEFWSSKIGFWSSQNEHFDLRKIATGEENN